jgi:hypothetical protein
MIRELDFEDDAGFEDDSKPPVHFPKADWHPFPQ